MDTVINKKEIENHNILLKTRVFFKKTDTHQLLHTGSFHPKHTTKGIPKSQLLRFKRISSSKMDYDRTCKILFNTLKSRRYTRTNLRNQQKNIWFEYQNKNQAGSKLHEKTLPIIVNYDSVGITLSKKYKQILSDSEFFQNFRIITAYKNHTNLRENLVSSELI